MPLHKKASDRLRAEKAARPRAAADRLRHVSLLSVRRARSVVGGVLWLTTAQFFVVQAVAQNSWRGSEPYSLTRSWISDLGAVTCGTYRGGGGALVCSPRHALVNTGFVVLGIQVLAGAILLQPVLGKGRSAHIATWMLVIAGAALPFVAGFPEDTGRPWHAVFATIHLATAGLGMVAAGLALWSTGRLLAGAASFVLGLASLVGTLLTGAGSGAGVGRAAVERLAAWPFTAWTTLAGAGVLIAATSTKHRGSRCDR